MTQTSDSVLNVTITKIPKSEICPDPNINQRKDEPSRLGGKTKKLRYKPKRMEAKSTFIGKVIEIISDPYRISPLESKDRCYRLDGEILTVPQTEEEEQVLAKVQRDFMMKKAANNVTFINENLKRADLWVGGETDEMAKVYPDLENRFDSGDLLYPSNGTLEFYHPITGVLLSPVAAMMMPSHFTFYNTDKLCIYCHSPFEKPVKGHFWFFRNLPRCLAELCPRTRNGNFACVFDRSPSLSVRGLCKESVMDIRYKLADHNPMSQNDNLKPDDWGLDSTRSYVGPKGWTISRSPNDKLWRMEHISYKDLSLTMLDMDALPLGRHQWRVENNVCNQGETSIETIQISACREDQFTCDDGKCLNIKQRCNNIEVSLWLLNNCLNNIIFKGL